MGGKKDTEETAVKSGLPGYYIPREKIPGIYLIIWLKQIEILLSRSSNSNRLKKPVWNYECSGQAE